MSKSGHTAMLESSGFVWFISLLIVYSVVCFSIETLPDLSDETRRFLSLSEYVVTGIFTVEYLYRIYAAKRRLKFIFSFYGLIDLIAILPFYLAFAVDLQSLRIVRLLRVLRVLKLARYNRAFNRFVEALIMSKEELVIFTLASIFMLYLAAVGIYHFEHAAQPDVFRSIFDCMWWAVATLTTVGYGDIYPITVGGRVFTFLVLMLGLGMIAVPTGIVASSLAAVKKRESKAKS